MANQNISCIISSYNENENNLLSIIKAISLVKAVSQIVLIDDGSTNKIADSEITQFSKLKFIKLEKNVGKSAAISTGINSVINTHILMFDADFHNIQSAEIDQIIQHFFRSNLDMLILQVTGGNNFVDRLFRKEVLFSGFRILKTDDLKKAYKMNPKRYQLEVAINEHMFKNNRQVSWSPTNVVNIHKTSKRGFFVGIIESIKMEISILMFLGPVRFARQVLFFAKNSI